MVTPIMEVAWPPESGEFRFKVKVEKAASGEPVARIIFDDKNPQCDAIALIGSDVEITILSQSNATVRLVRRTNMAVLRDGVEQ